MFSLCGRREWVAPCPLKTRWHPYGSWHALGTEGREGGEGKGSRGGASQTGGKFCIKLRRNPPIRLAPPARSDAKKTHSGNFVFSNETKNLGLMASCRNSGRMPRPPLSRRGREEGGLVLVSVWEVDGSARGWYVGEESVPGVCNVMCLWARRRVCGGQVAWH